VALLVVLYSINVFLTFSLSSARPVHLLVAGPAATTGDGCIASLSLLFRARGDRQHSPRDTGREIR